MMMKSLKYMPLALATLLPMLGAAPVEMKAQRVALFKNGYACVELQGQLQSGQQQQQITGMPTPVLGSFWWNSPITITRLQASPRELSLPAKAFSQSELLAANIGKQVTISALGQTFHGTITDTTNKLSHPSSFVSARKPTTTPQSNILVLRTPHGGSASIHVADIDSVEFAQADQVQFPTRTVQVTDLELDMAQAPTDEPLMMGCLAHGLSWMPTYQLNLGDNGQAQLTCTATIINDLVDLQGVELELVSGYPALGSALVPSPLTLTMKLAELTRALQSQIGESTASFQNQAYMTNSVSAYTKSAGAAGAIDIDRLKRAEDLFYYTLPNITCARGETIQCGVFTTEVSYRHVFTCSLPNQHIMQRLIRQGQEVSEVWHCVRLSNSGQLPWSTGVLTCYADSRLVSRSTLHYTPSGQESLLRLNKTFDALISSREEQLSSIPMPDKPNTTISTYHGSITIKNTSAKPMDMELTKEILGSPIVVSDNGTCTTTPAYRANPRSEFSWKLHLEPGQEHTCTYSYEYED